MSPSCDGSESSCFFPVLSEVSIAEEVDGMGDKGPGDTTMVDVQTLLDAFLNTSEIYLLHRRNIFW
jgi:hypothetical protein